MVKLWSKDEVGLLKKLFLIRKTQEVADKLGRPVQAVERKAYRVGLKKTNGPRAWSKDEDRLLKKLFTHRNKQEVADKLGRSVSSITNRAYKIGLKKTRKHLKNLGQK